ncbi:uncharacterized protein LOC124289095 [Haliotis rubra]|uniref:uncharacterized protein LOC124289095 n=1 Tax=Haliotis rubra TaxID=36100 RepID=UPI001EE577A5|nr:uncharacterized protein LOC124289095 [Haliotis rubra]
MSDHFNVLFAIDLIKPNNKHSILMCRNIKKIQPDSFRLDLVNSNLLTDPPPDVEDHVVPFHDTLTSLLDKHAPAVEKNVILRPHAPWYDESIRRSKTQRRRAGQWRKTRLEIHRQIYQQCRNATTSLIISAKRKYCLHSIQNSMGKPASLYRFMNKLLGKGGDGDRVPPGQSHMELADSFNSFFISKIDTIRQGLSAKEVDRCFSEPLFTGDPLTQFAPFTPKDIESIIRSSKPTTCDSDPIPTKLLFQYLDLLLPSITKIVNSSLGSSVFPSRFKHAVVKPLLKKPDLDSQNLQNYRPVSNLSFISKIIEKAVHVRLKDHLSKHLLLDEFQSAYRQYYSTEAALLQVTNGLRCAG